MKITEWQDYLERNKSQLYKCPDCKTYTARMERRSITEENSGESHQEYRIRCRTCMKKGSVHWTKNLAEITWEALLGHE